MGNICLNICVKFLNHQLTHLFLSRHNKKKRRICGKANLKTSCTQHFQEEKVLLKSKPMLFRFRLTRKGCFPLWVGGEPQMEDFMP